MKDDLYCVIINALRLFMCVNLLNKACWLIFLALWLPLKTSEL